jgi:hypothetical protein
MRSDLRDRRIWCGVRVGHDRFDRWVIAAVVVGTTLRFVNLGAVPLWFDETSTFHHLVIPWQGFLTAVERGPLASDEIPSVVEALPFDDERQRSVFMVGRAWLSDPDGNLQNALAERYATCQGVDVPGIRIHCYELRTEATVANARQ